MEVTKEAIKDLNPADLARIIRRNWPNVYFGAVPYLQAMDCLPSWQADYGQDPGRSIGLYFLANANTWRGDVARMVKAEMKRQLGVK